MFIDPTNTFWGPWPFIDNTTNSPPYEIKREKFIKNQDSIPIVKLFNGMLDTDHCITQADNGIACLPDVLYNIHTKKDIWKGVNWEVKALVLGLDSIYYASYHKLNKVVSELNSYKAAYSKLLSEFNALRYQMIAYQEVIKKYNLQIQSKKEEIKVKRFATDGLRTGDNSFKVGSHLRKKLVKIGDCYCDWKFKYIPQLPQNHENYIQLTVHRQELKNAVKSWKAKYPNENVMNSLEKSTYQCLLDHGMVDNALDFELNTLINFEANGDMKNAHPLDDIVE